MESRRDFDSMKRDTLTSTQAAAELNSDVFLQDRRLNWILALAG